MPLADVVCTKQAVNVGHQCYSKTHVNSALTYNRQFFVVTKTITLHLSLRIQEGFVLKCKIDQVNFNEPFLK